MLTTSVIKHNTMSFKTTLLLSIVILFAACATLPKPSFREELTGTWTTDKIRVMMNSIRNTDKDSVVIVASKDFMEHLGIYANVGHYHADGTFEDVYYASADSALMTTSGNWSTVGTDSMKIETTKPINRTSIYHVKVKKDRGIFTGLVDWDGDGQEDDEFTGKATRTR